MIRITTTALVLLLSACSSQKDNSQYEQLAKNKEMVCENRAQTGSNIKKKKCMSKDLAEAVHQKNQEALRRLDKKGQTWTDNKGG